jgi:hypothetical protein
MTVPYKDGLTVFWSAEDTAFVVDVPEGCMAHGVPPPVAVAAGQEAMQLWHDPPSRLPALRRAEVWRGVTTSPGRRGTPGPPSFFELRRASRARTCDPRLRSFRGRGHWRRQQPAAASVA